MSNRNKKAAAEPDSGFDSVQRKIKLKGGRGFLFRTPRFGCLQSCVEEDPEAKCEVSRKQSHDQSMP